MKRGPRPPRSQCKMYFWDSGDISWQDPDEWNWYAYSTDGTRRICLNGWSEWREVQADAPEWNT